MPCRCPGVRLADRTSFEIGGEAAELYAPANIEELREVLLALAEDGREPHVLGGGCNTLFPDGAFQRPIISTERLRGIAVEGNLLFAGAGARMEVLIRSAIEAGLGGLEVFVGIPGTAGGAVAMNAGGGGHSFGERVLRLGAFRIATGERVVLEGRQVAWGYRTARLDGLVVTDLELALDPAPVRDLRRRAREILRRKASVQPLSSLSAGCIFKNPPGGSAGLLIDRAGLKGAREGAAVVSPRHANFIVNEGGQATAREVLALAARVMAGVRDAFGVRLEMEIVTPRDD